MKKSLLKTPPLVNYRIRLFGCVFRARLTFGQMLQLLSAIARLEKAGIKVI